MSDPKKSSNLEPASAAEDDALDTDEPSTQQLANYRAKRQANATSEPFGGRSNRLAPPVGEPRFFVVQKHAARRRHFDLRLEMFGVLRSWAVPRGPSRDPSVKRLAIQTEDHPLEYVTFEGSIPDGNYGAGEMIVWDHGVWIPLEPVDTGLAEGKLLFDLRGNKLRGRWTLVRTKDGGGRHWLLIKKPDPAATPGHDGELDSPSVVSGLTLRERESGVDRHAELVVELERLQAPHRTLALHEIEPMLAESDDPFDDDDWWFELKYDGYRILAASVGGVVQLRYRSGRECTGSFPEIVTALSAFPARRFIIDAEVVVLDDDARPNFGRLQDRASLTLPRDVDRGMRDNPVTLYVFDLLGFADFDLRELPLRERKRLLRRLVPPIGIARYTDHIEGRGLALMSEVRRLGVEGVMAKHANSRYVSGRSDAWRKIRVEHTADLVVAGFVLPEGNRSGFRGLILGAYDGDDLVYVGRVGSGFSDRELLDTRALLDERIIDTPVIHGVPSVVKAIWTRPDLVAEIKYKNLSRDDILRAPVFLRWRPDKLPRACLRASLLSRAESPNITPIYIDLPEPEEPRRVVISNPDKVFWPESGYTKQHLIDYYRSISPWLIPYLRDRPLVLTRYPDGIAGKHFFQKNAPPYVPEWLRTQMLWNDEEKRDVEAFVCDDVEALTYVANMASIPLHVWASRLSSPGLPDWCILDLDPKGAPFRHVVAVAQHIHTLANDIGLPNFCKTSGSTGLHVLFPLSGQFTYAQCRQFSLILAKVVVSELSELATLERVIPKREGKVYLDYLQNGHGRLLVSPWCVRPRPNAPVSTPLLWSDVTEALDPSAFTIETVPERLAAHGDPMAPLLEQQTQLSEVLEALLPRLK